MYDPPVAMEGVWTDAFNGINGRLTAAAMATALAPIAGSVPDVVNHGDYFQIVFNPVQEERVAEWIRSQLNREPGPVRVDAGGIAIKVLTRQYWPWIIGVTAAGMALGYYGGRRGR